MDCKWNICILSFRKIPPSQFLPDLPASVGPDLAATHVHGDKEEQNGNFCPQSEVIEVCVKAPYHRKYNHEELQQSNGHDDKVDGRCMDFLVDLAACVNKSKIMPVDEVLEDEVETTKGGDEGAGNGEHDDHSKDKHHPGILLPKAEFIPEIKNRVKFILILCHLMAFLMLGVSALLREMQIWMRYQKSSGNL